MKNRHDEHKVALAVALMAFKNTLNLERQLEQQRNEVNAAVTRLDDDDFADYRRVTDELLYQHHGKPAKAA